MAQLSRPFQIALVAVCLLAGVWLFALQGRSTSTSGSSSAPASPATAHGTSPEANAAAKAKAAAAPTPIYHGSAPGVQGLTRAIAKAHEAVAASQHQAKQLEAKSAQASNETAPAQTASTAAPTAGASAKAAVPATKAAARASTTVPARTVHKASGAPRAASGVTVPSGQRTVEADLAKGDVVVLLFWDPKGTDDVSVHRALQLVLNAHRSARQQIAVQEAQPRRVASFGSVTRGVQVDATPTIFVINKHGQTIVLTGVQDAFSIEQAIDEARNP